MKTIMTSIVAMALCIGMASQTLAQGTSTTAPAKHNGEGHFAKMDTNGDGKISWDEMLAFHTAKWQARYQEHAAKVGTPKLTWDQVLAKRTAKLKARFQAMDTNGDGFVTKEEFRAYCAAHKGEHKHGDKTGSGSTNSSVMPTPVKS
jgi:hypothetical protein